MEPNVQANVDNLSGKYLTFRLLDEHYGINVDAILQIIAIPQITPIPRTPDFVKGVINLRGKIIPVIDLRLRFSLETTDYDERTSIIIIKVKASNKSNIFIGIIVDTVLEVLDIENSQIEDSPQFGVELETSYILGMAKMKGNVVTLLDIQNVLTQDELINLQKVNKDK